MKYLIIFVVLLFGFLEGVENSIVPVIEAAVSKLPQQKYSKRQWVEIEEALQHKKELFRVVTFNMLANDTDEKREEVNRWQQRVPRIVDVLNEMHPDVLCPQELYQDQLDDLYPYLEEKFNFYGEPRLDGELNGVFFNKGRFDPVKEAVWRLESTGNTLTMVQLKDKGTEKLFAVFNTHLSFGANEREEEIRFIKEILSSVASSMPILFMGDLNTFPQRLDLDKLPFYDGDYTHRLLTEERLIDARDCSLLGHFGPLSTFTNAPGSGIPFQGIGTPGVMLDHIYVSKGIGVLIHAVQPGTVQGHFPSDHMPLLIDGFL